MIALALALVAYGAPVQLAHGGRVLDSMGAPLDGPHTVVLTVYDQATGGTQKWRETQTVAFDQGYFAVRLGDDVATNPLDDALFDGGALFLGIKVDAGAELARTPLTAAPYAVRARTATSVDGGAVDATEIRVGGQLVIDGTGTLVGDLAGPTLGDLTCTAGQVPRWSGTAWACASQGSVSWGSLTGVPADLLDGDADTLATKVCPAGNTLRYAGGAWTCAVALTEADVEGMITDDSLDLHAGTTIGGAQISTGPHTVDTVLTEAQVEGYVTNGPLNLAAGSTMGGVALSTGPHTVDTKLTEAEVEAFVRDGAIDLAAGSTMDGAALSTGPHTVDTVLTEQQVEAYVTNGPLDLHPSTTIGGIPVSALDPVVVDFRYAQTSSPLTITGTFPWDDTIPQITEGGEVVSLQITPKKVGNLLVFSGVVNWEEPTNTANYLTLGLFRAGTSDAIATAADGASNGNGRCTGNDTYDQICALPIRFTAVAASTTAQTYSLRIGLDGGPVRVNHGFKGRRLGGVLVSSLQVTEIAQ